MLNIKRFGYQEKYGSGEGARQSGKIQGWIDFFVIVGIHNCCVIEAQ